MQVMLNIWKNLRILALVWMMSHFLYPLNLNEQFAAYLS